MRAREQTHFVLHVPLLLKHIEARASEYTVLKRFNQRRGLNHRAARGVDKIRAFFYLRNILHIYEMVRFFYIRHMQRDYVTVAEQFRQFRVRKPDFFCKCIVFKCVTHKHLHAEAFRNARGVLAYFAAADHADCLARQVKTGHAALRKGAGLGYLFVRVAHLAREREQKRKGELRHRWSAVARHARHGNAAPLGFLRVDMVCAGRAGCYQLKFRIFIHLGGIYRMIYKNRNRFRVSVALLYKQNARQFLLNVVYLPLFLGKINQFHSFYYASTSPPAARTSLCCTLPSASTRYSTTAPNSISTSLARALGTDSIYIISARNALPRDTTSTRCPARRSGTTVPM